MTDPFKRAYAQIRDLQIKEREGFERQLRIWQATAVSLAGVVLVGGVMLLKGDSWRRTP